MPDVQVIALLALFIAVVGLDQTAVGQFMLSTPLVAGWLMGLLVGRPLEGLMAGALMQFLCCVELPVGASVPPDGSFAGMAGTALFLVTPLPPRWDAISMLGMTALLFFPIAYLARAFDISIRRVNGRWTRAAASAMSTGSGGLAQAAALGGIPLFFLKNFFLGLAILWMVPAFLSAFSPQAASFGGPLATTARVVPFICLGILAAGSRMRGGRELAALGFAAGTIFTMAVR